LESITVIGLADPLAANACQANCISPPTNIYIAPGATINAPPGAPLLGINGEATPFWLICDTIDTNRFCVPGLWITMLRLFGFGGATCVFDALVIAFDA
jgi:hypothetical protein